MNGKWDRVGGRRGSNGRGSVILGALRQVGERHIRFNGAVGGNADGVEAGGTKARFLECDGVISSGQTERAVVTRAIGSESMGDSGAGLDHFDRRVGNDRACLVAQGAGDCAGKFGCR